MTKFVRHFQMDFSLVSLTQNDKGAPSLQVDFSLRLRLASHIKKASVAVIQTNSPNFALHPLQNLTQLCGYKAF